ncbi:START-like domain-containing protein [Portibacter marinus]|uniref:START-like domain-containing protein n=1 Tax=Portibacter marinus TaxID=2898660 RepID=UPI001F1A9C4A|nr:START-like domain-containing protein [Portibacter marinus]
MSRVQINMEFIFRASPAILYSFLTSPSTLIRWFCDEVDIQDDVYTFSWDGAEEVAELIDDIEEERLKFQWEDADDDEYLEFKMYKSDVTNETVLEIIDWCDDDEVDEQKDLWETQINKLRIECGG